MSDTIEIQTPGQPFVVMGRKGAMAGEWNVRTAEPIQRLIPARTGCRTPPATFQNQWLTITPGTGPIAATLQVPAGYSADVPLNRGVPVAARARSATARRDGHRVGALPCAVARC